MMPPLKGLPTPWLSPFAPAVLGGLRPNMKQFDDGSSTLLSPNKFPSQDVGATNMLGAVCAPPRAATSGLGPMVVAPYTVNPLAIPAGDTVMVISNWNAWTMPDGSQMFGSFQWDYEGTPIPDDTGPGVFFGTTGPCMLIFPGAADGTFGVTLTGKCGSVRQTIELAFV